MTSVIATCWGLVCIGLTLEPVQLAATHCPSLVFAAAVLAALSLGPLVKSLPS